MYVCMYVCMYVYICFSLWECVCLFVSVHCTFSCTVCTYNIQQNTCSYHFFKSCNRLCDWSESRSRSTGWSRLTAKQPLVHMMQTPTTPAPEQNVSSITSHRMMIQHRVQSTMKQGHAFIQHQELNVASHPPGQIILSPWGQPQALLVCTRTHIVLNKETYDYFLFSAQLRSLCHTYKCRLCQYDCHFTPVCLSSPTPKLHPLSSEHYTCSTF